MIATEKITLTDSSHERELAAVEMVSRAEEKERKSKEGLTMVREMAKVVGKRRTSEMLKAKDKTERAIEAME